MATTPAACTPLPTRHTAPSSTNRGGIESVTATVTVTVIVTMDQAKKVRSSAAVDVPMADRSGDTVTTGGIRLRTVVDGRAIRRSKWPRRVRQKMVC